jgi:hypothetical protein
MLVSDFLRWLSPCRLHHRFESGSARLTDQKVSLKGSICDEAVKSHPRRPTLKYRFKQQLEKLDGDNAEG